MSDELIAGGEHRPSWMEGTAWDVPWGFPVNKMAYWRGRRPATEEDCDLVRKHKGFDIDEKSLCGILAREWDTQFFFNKYGDREILLSVGKLDDPWERLPVPGGLGSWAYQSQHLPDGIDGCAGRRNWLWYEAPYMDSLPEGSEHTVVRSEGGEPYHLRKSREDCPRYAGTAVWDRFFGGCPGTESEGVAKIVWDADNQWFKLPS